MQPSSGGPANQVYSVPPWPAFPRAVLGLLLLGTILRVAQYAFNRSLWLDEASLADNIVSRSYSGLMLPLAHDQGAPLGFLFVEKAVTSIFGTSEYALRLIPLLAGLAAMLVFARVARRILVPTAALFGLAIFVLYEPLLYFSSEAKQYSNDVLVCVLLIWLALEVGRRHFSWGVLWLAALGGAAAIWVSHPAVFVLAGLGSSWVIWLAVRRAWPELTKVVLVGLAWLGSLILSYTLSLASLIDSPGLQRYWQARFLPWRATWLDPAWWGDAVHLRTLGPILLGTAVLIALGAGLRKLLREVPHVVMLLVLPACYAVLAGLLHLYPLASRLVLFLFPLGVLILAAGAAALASQMNARLRYSGTGLLLLALAPLLGQAGYHLLVPRTKEEVRTEVQWIAARQRPGDVIYVYYGTQAPFEYYARRLGLTLPEIAGRSSRTDPSAMAEDAAHLPANPRVWLLFSHVYHQPRAAADDEHLLVSRLDQTGRRLEQHLGVGSDVYLYDLRGF